MSEFDYAGIEIDEDDDTIQIGSIYDSHADIRKSNLKNQEVVDDYEDDSRFSKNNHNKRMRDDHDINKN